MQTRTGPTEPRALADRSLAREMQGAAHEGRNLVPGSRRHEPQVPQRAEGEDPRDPPPAHDRRAGAPALAEPHEREPVGVLLEHPPPPGARPRTRSSRSPASPEARTSPRGSRTPPGCLPPGRNGRPRGGRPRPGHPPPPPRCRSSRCGYLFYGPPGSGKTSIAMMLARRFVERADGVAVHIESTGELVGAVGLMRSIEPGRPSMYLIEEADDFVDDNSCLSILDGEMSIHRAVFVAMTNYQDRLPPRISNRPGRFDRVLMVDCPPAGVQVEYLRRVASRNPGLASEGPSPEKIVKALEGLPVSMAHLREAFIASV